LAVEAIRQPLEVLLKELQLRKEKAADLSPEFLAKKVFSRKEALHARTGAFKNGVLYLKADSSTWLYYFNLHKKELLEKFSQANSQIKDLKFSLGEFVRAKQA
jgi:predicted nucleic acid-binding Zn ribbon protein